MVRLSVLCVALACFAGCNADADGDGLSKKEELDLGTDPDNADSDGDGLADGDEITLGTDPLLADSDGDLLLDGEEAGLGLDPLVADADGDGYLDGWELLEDKDPLDVESVIYQGGWPYNPTKSDLAEVDFDSPYKVGSPVPHYKATDQFGETFDIYDAFGQGKPVIIDLSAVWCGPCNEMARWLDGGSSQTFKSNNRVRKAVDEGDIIWVTVIIEGDYQVPATAADSTGWYMRYPHPKVPVIPDDNVQFYMWTRSSYVPTLILVGSDGLVLKKNNNSYAAVLDAAQALLPAEAAQ